ncbi:hypothetical protein HMPREF2533_00508 [Bacteroides fragilis]|nr:hypothetical protein HMPREF2530_00508 [Bacteroides fragilis]KXU50091.1 hypothetical protein HMPREF2533_00508 [Bacteroides fragilis]
MRGCFTAKLANSFQSFHRSIQSLYLALIKLLCIDLNFYICIAQTDKLWKTVSAY